MAHYALLDEQNIVTQVIVGMDEGEDGIDWEVRYSEICGQRCKRTSYNTRGGVHYVPDGPRIPSDTQHKAFRKNYAGIGYYYDEQIDAFIPPKPYPSWVLDESTCLWVAPVPRPNDGLIYMWDEDSQQWIL